MGQREIEALFERWQRERDADALGAVFDRTSPELWKIALSLAPNAADAEDALQATFLVAVERAASFDPNKRLVPWLAGILVRTIGRARRDRGRVVDASRIELRRAREPHEDVLDAETRAVLTRALAEIAPSDRAVLEAVLFADKKPADIARDTGREPGSVRMQIHRGLERLRRFLPPSYATSSAWTAMHGRGLDAVRAAVLAKAKTSAFVGGAAVGSSAVLVFGGVTMTTKVLYSSVVAVALAALAWLAWPSPRSAQPAAADLNPSRASDLASIPHEPSASVVKPAQRVAIEAASNVPVVPTASARTPLWLLRGKVRGAPAGREEETKIGAVLTGRYNIPTRVECSPTRDGGFEIDLTPLVNQWPLDAGPAEVLVSAEHPLCLREIVQLAFDSGVEDATEDKRSLTVFRCEITLRAGAIATGRVEVPSDWQPYDEGQAPVRPLVGLAEVGGEAKDDNSFLDSTVCDVEGRWTLRADHAGSFRVVAAGEGLRPATGRVELVMGVSTEVAPVLMTRGELITGVVYRTGAPLGAGASVVATPKTRGPSWYFARHFSQSTRSLMAVDAGYENETIRANTLADGSFRLTGLAPIEYELTVESTPRVRAALGMRQRVERLVRAPASGVVLEGVLPTIVLSATVNGAPPKRSDLDQVEVELVATTPGHRGMKLDLTGSDRGYGAIQVESGVDYELRVPPGHYATKTDTLAPLAIGEERIHVLDLRTDDSSTTLELRLVTDEKEPVTSAEFAWSRAGESDHAKDTILRLDRATDGVFHFEGRPVGRYFLEIRPIDAGASGSLGHYVGTRIEIELSPKSTVKREVTLELGARVRMSAKDERGTLVGPAVALRDRRGETLATNFYCRMPEAMYGCGWRLCEHGVNDHPALPVGQYEFTLSSEGLRDEVVKVDLEAGETRTIEVTMHPR